MKYLLVLKQLDGESDESDDESDDRTEFKFPKINFIIATPTYVLPVPGGP